MFENKNMDALKHEVPICGYVEAILGRKQILQDKKNPKHPFTDILQNMLKKISTAQTVVLCLSVTAFLAEAS